MANAYNISSLSYRPSYNMDWFTQAVFGGKLIESGKITPVTGVKESTRLNLIEFTGNVLQPDKHDCSWTPEQIIRLSEKELSIKTFKINLEQCIDDLEQKRLIWMLKPGARNTQLPEALEEATLEILAAEVNNEIEEMLFTGDNSRNPNEFDGAVKVLSESAESVKVKGPQLTKDNIIGEIEKLFEAIPHQVLQKGLERNSLAIYMSYESFTRLRLAIASLPAANLLFASNFTSENGKVHYMGIEIVPVKGMPSSVMIAADVNNMLLGTDLLNDFENIRIGQFAAPYDSKIYIDGRLRIGFAIPFEGEAVIYSANE
jgi:hypothetical protein